MTNNLKTILTTAFRPTRLEIVDESHKHAGHNPDAQKGGTHFNIVIVSNAFEGKRLVDRHRMIYDALKTVEFSYHALAITAKSPKEVI